MKTLIFLIVFCSISISTFSQQFKKFKVGVGLGYTSVTSDVPPLLYLEPAYRINDTWAIGLRLESGGFNSNSDNDLITNSFGLNGQYYFSSNKFRPFAGLGFSFYSPEPFIGVSFCDCSITYEKNKLGFYPRLGFDYGHLSFNMEYNIAGSSKITTTSMFTHIPTVTGYVDNNYFSTKVGVLIGGGKKK
jgi:outer membrane protein X